MDIYYYYVCIKGIILDSPHVRMHDMCMCLMIYFSIGMYAVGAKIQHMCCMKTWLLCLGILRSFCHDRVYYLHVVSFVMNSVMTGGNNQRSMLYYSQESYYM